jgi:hypothetical protein
MDGIVNVLCSIISRLIAEEVKDWCPVIASWVTNRCVRLLPEDIRERYSEEWHSHLEDTPGRLSKAITAIEFAFAAFKISRLGSRWLMQASAALLMAYCLPLAL